MLLIKISSKRVWIISEYYILVPLMLIIDTVLIIKTKKKRKREKAALEKNKKRSYKTLRIWYAATNNLIGLLKLRGGEEFFDDVILEAWENYIRVTHPKCNIGNGLRYVNNERLRKLVFSLFRSKAKNGIIYITKEALCHLALMYGKDFLALPIPVTDFIRISGYKQLIEKIMATVVVGRGLYVAVIAQTSLCYIHGLTVIISGMIFAGSIKDPKIINIDSELVPGSFDSIKRRVADQKELISVYFDKNPVPKNKITMSPFSDSSKHECLLPEQVLVNQKCTLKPGEIVEILKDPTFDLKYNEVVNMEDVLHLKSAGTVRFSDNFEFPREKPMSPIRLRGTKRLRDEARSKTVNFLEKFGDSNSIPEVETWDSSTANLNDVIEALDHNQNEL